MTEQAKLKELYNRLSPEKKAQFLFMLQTTLSMLLAVCTSNKD
ncbi:MAG: hypothetical protein V3G42_13920 [Oscillospiraceae bacterium]